MSRTPPLASHRPTRAALRLAALAVCGLACATGSARADQAATFTQGFRDICMAHVARAKLYSAFERAGWRDLGKVQQPVFRQSFLSAVKYARFAAPAAQAPDPVYAGVVSGNGKIGRTDTVCFVRYVARDPAAPRAAFGQALGQSPARQRADAARIADSYSAPFGARVGFEAERLSSGGWLVTGYRHAAERM